MSFQDSINNAKLNFRSEYPKTEGTRHTVGNIPTRLHAEIMELAEAQHITTPMLVMALMHFAVQKHKGEK